MADPTVVHPSAGAGGYTPLTIGSLFSGIGGLELGVEGALAELGVASRIVWQAESDRYARAVLARLWPAVHRYEDVHEIDDRAERPDIICGGFPCQDLSLAGGRRGLDGARSGLWSEQARVVRVLRPGYAFVENVPGRVLGDLAELGFDAAHDQTVAQRAAARARALEAHGRGRENRERERLWLSPHCLRDDSPRQLDLVGGTVE